MKHPTMLYKVPGPHETNGGVTFDYVIVDKDDITEYEEYGWKRTLTDAMSNEEVVKEVKEVTTKRGRPPSAKADK